MSDKNKMQLSEEITLYSILEASKILKVTKQALYTWVRAGEIEASKVGREYRISEKAIKDFLAKNRHK